MMSPQKTPRLPVLLVGLAALVAVAGCGAGTGSDGRLVRVSGKVTWNGQPLTRGTIQFIPASKTPGGGPRGRPMPATGRIDDQGHYSMMTRKPGDGVRPGNYLVMIDDDLRSPEELPGSGKTDEGLLPSEFASTATSGLTVTIDSESDEQEVDFPLPQNQ